MLKTIFVLIAITFLPFLELRASIPFGIFGMQEHISWMGVVLICVVTNIILGWLIFWVLGPVFALMRRWTWFDEKCWPILERTR